MARGCCCVMQCSAPRPQISSTQWMPTTSRSGNRRARVASATRSLRIVERGHQHQPVGDVEVRVAGGQPLAGERPAARGMGSFTTFRPAARSRRVILAQRLDSWRPTGRPPTPPPRYPRKRSAPGRRRGRAYRRRRCRCAARSPARSPDNRGSARSMSRAAHPRIARLHVAQQAFLGGQQQARAIDVDAAAFQHHLRLRTAAAPDASPARGTSDVLLPIVVFGPAR